MDLIKNPNFVAHVEDLLREHHVPGLAIATVQNEEIESAAYGQASLDPPKKCTVDTLFDIASSSKSLTAASVGLFVHDEKHPNVQYDATMSSLLPEDFVASSNEYTKGITVEDVLGHRNGYPSHDDSTMGISSDKTDTARSVTRNLRNLAPVAPLRSKYLYSNMMFTIATHLVEDLSGSKFPDFLEERFFKPLGMTSTNLQPERARSRGLGERIATGYFWDKKTEKYRVIQCPESPETQGAGSIITSVEDYIKYVRAMMNQKPPFTEEMYNGLIKARTLSDPDYKELRPHTSPTLYAAGWETRWYRGRMIVMHDGLVAGFGSTHFFLPDLKFGGVILGNSSFSGIVASILAHELIDEVLQVPKDQREDWNKIESAKGGEEFEEPDVNEVKQELCPGIEEPEPLTIPLNKYTGEYFSAGYKTMKVEHKDGELFIDATGRTSDFTIRFEHVCSQTKFIGHLIQRHEGSDDPLRSEFVFDGDGNILKMGLHLEAELEELIWFDKV